MEELNNNTTAANGYTAEVEEESAFNIRNLMAIFILNWKWFVFSILLCLGIAYTYLRYTTPVYQAAAKMLVKDENGGRSSRRSLMSAENLGMMSNSQGIDNEMEIIASRSIALEAVKQLKLYTSYYHEGRIVDRLYYKNQPLTIDLDLPSLEKLNMPINLRITYKAGKYEVHGQYTIVHKGERGYEPREINAVLPVIPARIKTSVGFLTFLPNAESTAHMKEGQTLIVNISPLANTAAAFAGKLGVQPTSRSTSILLLTLTDVNVQRATDYLKQLVTSYNEEANNDKNIIAVRTEEFINSRLEKINAELGMTEGQLESFKRQNRVVEIGMTASNAFSQSTN